MVTERARKFGTWLQAGILIGCLLLSISCAARVEYVQGTSRAYRIRAGETSPIDGWAISDQVISDLLECCRAAKGN